MNNTLLEHGTKFITQARQEWKKLLIQREHLSPILAPDFNIFSWRRKTDENMLTSTMAFLLNPNSTHGQKFIFLQKFVESIKELASSHKTLQEINTRELNYNKAQINTEYNIGNGRIDLVVEFPSFTFALENKIYAGEQPNQIKRYFDFLQKRENFILILLTKDIREEYDKEDNNSNEKTDTKILNDHRFLYLTFEEFFPNWLNKAMCEIQSFKVKFFVEDFLKYTQN